MIRVLGALLWLSMHIEAVANKHLREVFLKEFGGKVIVEAKGILYLSFLDDKREIHTFKIPNFYFVLELELTLLCPQK